MKLVIERPQVEAMVQAFPHLAPLSDQLRLGNRVEAPLSRFGQAELARLRDLYAATGRDIKGLDKLVGKYCRQKQTPPDLEAFRRCAMFRALDLQH